MLFHCNSLIAGRSIDAPTVSRPRHNRRDLLKSSALALLPLAIPSANHASMPSAEIASTSRLPSTTLVKAKLPGPALILRGTGAAVFHCLSPTMNSGCFKGICCGPAGDFSLPGPDQPCQVTSPDRSPAFPTQPSVLPVGAGLTLAQHEA